MRTGIFAALAIAATSSSTTAAAPQGMASLLIDNAAARVVVIPEARSDIAVTVTRGSAQLPELQVRRRGNSVEIDGGLKRRIRNCGTQGVGVVRDTGDAVRPDAQWGVEINGVGRVRGSDLPLITARVPMSVSISASGAVLGSVGRSQRLDLSNAGCGDWTVANVAGPMKLSIAGSGDIMAGSARSAQVSLAGSGDVRLANVSEGLEASIAGSGDIRAGSVGGRVNASIAGSGDVVIEAGRVSDVDASIAGSGDIRIEAVAQSLDASIMGSGDVRVAQVIGPVDHSIMGSGSVTVGDRRYGRRDRRN